MRVLVTGAGGFIGRHIVEYLRSDEQFSVVANCRAGSPVFNITSSYRNDRPVWNKFPVEVAVCNLLNPEWLPGPFDAVVHCAAAAGPWHSDVAIARDNLSATANLVREAEIWGAKFIFLSSISVHGDPIGIVNEFTLTDPLSFYAKSKLASEGVLEISSMPSITLRLPGVIGPGANSHNWLVNVAQKIKAGETIRAFNLDAQFNNAVHVHDLSAFVAKLLKHKIVGHDVVVLGARSSIRVESAIVRLADNLGLKTKIEKIGATRPSFVINSLKAMNNYGYDPMNIKDMLDRYATEI